jgi:quinol monooxygenase YgiN
MDTSRQVRFVIEIEVTDIPGFVDAVNRCVEISRSEPGTLVYDWYLDEATGAARLYEAYDSIDSVLVHAAGPVFTEVGPELLTTCTFVRMDAFGDVGDLADRGTYWPTTFWGKPFSALHG